MKKVIGIIAALLVMVFVADGIAGSFTAISGNRQDRIIAELVAAVNILANTGVASADIVDETITTDDIDDDTIDADDIGTIVQVDTNATTTITGYTPEFVGQVLIGLENSTNMVWISKGVTTNDWVAVVAP